MTTLLDTSTYTTAKSKFVDGLKEIVGNRTPTAFPSEPELRELFSRIPKGSIDKKVATGALALANWKTSGILSSAIDYTLLATSKDDGSEDSDKATSLLIKMSNAATLLKGFNQVLIQADLSLF